MKRWLVLLAMVAVVACKSVTSGVVVQKNYAPAYDYITTECMGYDSKGNCRFFMPVTHHVYESWSLELRDDSEDKPTKDQDTGWVDVDAATFGQYKLGSHYP